MDVTKLNEAGAETKNRAKTGTRTSTENDAADDEGPVFDVGALVESHPVGTLLGALGVGYVLGGGLFTSLTRRLLGVGMRLGFQLAVLPALEREVVGIVGGQEAGDPTPQ
ncbi:MAG: hypothetical protein JWM82_2096 [Myxococcales bacterium]|nr:hypothetical protein [Myxococcales bacterium]